MLIRKFFIDFIKSFKVTNVTTPINVIAPKKVAPWKKVAPIKPNNVKAIDSDSGVTLLADNLDLLSNESATVYNNVILKDGKESYMQADLIKYDFNTKFYKVSMFGIYEKIKAKLINWINEEQKI